MTKCLKSVLAIIACMLLSKLSISQTETNTTFSDRVNYVFQLLEKQKVPYGMLQDYAMEFTNLENFSGAVLTDSNKVMTPEFWDIYKTLYFSRIHANGNTLQKPAAADSAWQSQRDTGKIVLAGLFYKYARFKDNAQTSLIIQNDQVKDKYVNAVWQNPYVTQQVFAISPSTEIFQGRKFKVILPTQLWQSNAAGEVSKISINLNDGAGYKNIAINTPITVSYADTGLKTWQFKLQLTNGQMLYSHTQIKIVATVWEQLNGINAGSSWIGSKQDEVIPFIAAEAYNGTKAKGYITIHYADAINRPLRNPLIVAEGFDPGHIIHPEKQFGETDLEYFVTNVFNSKSIDLKNLLLTNPQYDIIYVDWKNGTDYLQRNALLLDTIIQWVNKNKEPLPGGGFADNVVLGISMGGAISRWALKNMEQKGIQHHTKMFVSMDAPMLGANVPTAYQYMSMHLKNFYVKIPLSGAIELFQMFAGGLSPFKALALGDRPAAKQMLINYVSSTGAIDNSMHTAWQNELKAKGYPSQNSIRNIAISNGAECASPQPFLPGASLLNMNGKMNTRFLGDVLGLIGAPYAGVYLHSAFYLGMLPGRNEISFDFSANAQPLQGVTQQIYHGKLAYKKKLMGIIGINVTLTNRNNNSTPSLLPLDSYSGGEINTGFDLNDQPVKNALIKYNVNATHIPTFCFVPTPSALDIGQNNVALTDVDYKIRYAGSVPPLAPRNSPFVNFVTAFNDQKVNEHHTDFAQRNGNWLAAELTNMPFVTGCNATCNASSTMQLSGTQNDCNTATIYANLATTANYVWNVGGDLLIDGVTTTKTTTNNFINVTGTGGGINVTGTNSCSTFQGWYNYNPYERHFTGNYGTYSLCWENVSIFVNTTPEDINYKWYLNNILVQEGMSNGYVGLGNPGDNTIKVEVETSCGNSNSLEEVFFWGCGYNGLVAKPNIDLFPNPAGSQVSISLRQINNQNTRNSFKEIREIKIMDKVGITRKIIKLPANTKAAIIDVSNFSTDIYYIEVSDGKNKANIPLSIYK